MNNNIENTAKEVSNQRIKQVNKYLADSRSKSLFVAAMTLLFVIVFFVFGILPGIQSFLSRIEENNKIDNETSKAQMAISDFEKMQSEKQNSESLISRLNEILPESLDQPNVITEIEQIAQASGSFLQTISFSLNDNSFEINVEYGLLDQIKNTTVNITFESSYQGVSSFIRSLESSRRVFSIDFINVIKKSADAVARDGFNREYQVNLQVKYFYWLDEVI